MQPNKVIACVYCVGSLIMNTELYKSSVQLVNLFTTLKQLVGVWHIQVKYITGPRKEHRCTLLSAVLL